VGHSADELAEKPNPVPDELQFDTSSHQRREGAISGARSARKKSHQRRAKRAKEEPSAAREARKRRAISGARQRAKEETPHGEQT
jgi:hypothetical protein